MLDGVSTFAKVHSSGTLPVIQTLWRRASPCRISSCNLFQSSRVSSGPFILREILVNVLCSPMWLLYFKSHSNQRSQRQGAWPLATQPCQNDKVPLHRPVPRGAPITWCTFPVFHLAMYMNQQWIKSVIVCICKCMISDDSCLYPYPYRILVVDGSGSAGSRNRSRMVGYAVPLYHYMVYTRYILYTCHAIWLSKIQVLHDCSTVRFWCLVLMATDCTAASHFLKVSFFGRIEPCNL